MAENKGLSLEEIKKESVDLVCFYSFFFVFVLSHNVFVILLMRLMRKVVL